MPYGIFRYSVEHSQITFPDDNGIWHTGGGEWLMLTACHPPTSAEKRIIVKARLVDHGPPRRRA